MRPSRACGVDLRTNTEDREAAFNYAMDRRAGPAGTAWTDQPGLAILRLVL